MFQDINAAKSAPFTLLTIYQKSMYPPKVVKKPRFSKLREIRRPFFDLDHEKWKAQISQQIARNFAQFANHHGEPREIRAIIANFYHSLLLKCTRTFYSESRKIRPIR